MSATTCEEPSCHARSESGIELVIQGSPRDLGGFSVRRLLPSSQRRLVGPFIFFDHMGPAQFAAGSGIDVRPHPHIGLATVTYLFEGEIMHRDSLGSAQAIRPSDVNWMVAGRGIVHSERTAPERRAAPHLLHGIQAWVALPREAEECEPSFHHHPASELPASSRAGASLRVIAGSAYGLQSPVRVASPTLYVAAELAAGAELALPSSAEHAERAFYVASGSVSVAADSFSAGSLVVARAGAEVSLRAGEAARVMLLGGAPLAGERQIFWNFVSSSPERIERAKADWQARRFPLVPGDEREFTPLPT
jgi:redox-sensitive bicupin YhaK (pirin superfamily)